MAMLGGIGIVHKNLSVQKQAAVVRAVKHHLNGLIEQPVTFQAEQTLADVKRIRQEKSYTFSGFPIVDHDHHLVGILTASDVKFTRDLSLRIADDALYQAKTSGRKRWVGYAAGTAPDEPPSVETGTAELASAGHLQLQTSSGPGTNQGT